MKMVLLPGFDGTGRLYGPLLQALPSEIAPVVVAYPADRICSANELLDIVLSHLPQEEPYVLVAESFSGPIALRACNLQLRPPLAVILCASFFKCPFPRIALRMLGLCWNPLARCRPPRWMVRRYLLDEASAEIESLFYKAILAVSSSVLAHRFAVLCEFDGQYAPESLKCPFLYLQATRDRLIGARHLRLLKQRYPAMRVEGIESPHLVLQVRPDASARVILNFLARQESI
jgi:pimeloyl-ACP methyl ester carboxylesterase